jgi:hypothetical protein
LDERLQAGSRTSKASVIWRISVGTGGFVDIAVARVRDASIDRILEIGFADGPTRHRA